MRIAFVLCLLAGCNATGLPGPTEPAPTSAPPLTPQSAACTIELDGQIDPNAARLDLRVDVVQPCAYCNPVDVRVAEVFALERPNPPGRWLGGVRADYGTQSILACDALESGVPYPALVVWVDLDGDGRCTPGADQGVVDQRYTWCCRDELFQVRLDSLQRVDQDFCDLLPRN